MMEDNGKYLQELREEIVRKQMRMMIMIVMNIIIVIKFY